ncbi:RNase adapter RapZ [Ligilactobacillus hohenheimensis]|uniref:RNase adapter RapZ n=1 Tax=Ligilactobacillus hohenheimensis TaxID=2991832 RepID=UPI0024BB1794|nr:RNase adapter RapZ [Ligilactobacillus hohenheimensis]
MANDMDLVIITGMSGAGKTVTMQSFEDLGYFCVDNMPPLLLPKLMELLHNSAEYKRVALVMDARSPEFYKEIVNVLQELDTQGGVQPRIVFLDSSDEELVARYKETRRSHPLAMGGRVLDGIKKERAMLAEMRSRASVVIDTSTISPRQLREKIFQKFATAESEPFHVQVVSFGFKYGLPIDADVVMDVRFLPNPYYVPELKEKTGMDKDVYDYVMNSPRTEEFYQNYLKTLRCALPGYIDEGKTSLTIAIGCTGGQHRSVAIARRLAADLQQDGQYPVRLFHRDSQRRKETVNRS